MPIWVLDVIKKIGFPLLIIAFIISTFAFTYFTGYNRGYRKALIENPTNVYNAPATVIQKEQIRGVGLHIGKGILGYGY
jgi:hypothetical protein